MPEHVPFKLTVCPLHTLLGEFDVLVGAFGILTTLISIEAAGDLQAPFTHEA